MGIGLEDTARRFLPLHASPYLTVPEDSHVKRRAKELCVV
jgi:hypothetical protein